MLNRTFRIFFSFILLATVLFFSCKKDAVTNNLPCTTPGILEVRVCNSTQTYFGPAEVFLYATDSARTADVNRTSYLYKRLTSSTTPDSEGAFFYNLEQKRYYFYGRFVSGSNTFTGTGDSYVSNCKSIIAICVVI